LLFSLNGAPGAAKPIDTARPMPLVETVIAVEMKKALGDVALGFFRT
jgi:hypothetical protein